MPKIPTLDSATVSSAALPTPYVNVGREAQIILQTGASAAQALNVGAASIQEARKRASDTRYMQNFNRLSDFAIVLEYGDGEIGGKEPGFRSLRGEQILKSGPEYSQRLKDEIDSIAQGYGKNELDRQRFMNMAAARIGLTFQRSLNQYTLSEQDRLAVAERKLFKERIADSLAMTLSHWEESPANTSLEDFAEMLAFAKFTLRNNKMGMTDEMVEEEVKQLERQELEKAINGLIEGDRSKTAKTLFEATKERLSEDQRTSLSNKINKGTDKEMLQREVDALMKDTGPYPTIEQNRKEDEYLLGIADPEDRKYASTLIKERRNQNMEVLIIENHRRFERWRPLAADGVKTIEQLHDLDGWDELFEEQRDTLERLADKYVNRNKPGSEEPTNFSAVHRLLTRAPVYGPPPADGVGPVQVVGDRARTVEEIAAIPDSWLDGFSKAEWSYGMRYLEDKRDEVRGNVAYMTHSQFEEMIDDMYSPGDTPPAVEQYATQLWHIERSNKGKDITVERARELIAQATVKGEKEGVVWGYNEAPIAEIAGLPEDEREGARVLMTEIPFDEYEPLDAFLENEIKVEGGTYSDLPEDQKMRWRTMYYADHLIHQINVRKGIESFIYAPEDDPAKRLTTILESFRAGRERRLAEQGQEAFQYMQEVQYQVREIPDRLVPKITHYLNELHGNITPTEFAMKEVLFQFPDGEFERMYDAAFAQPQLPVKSAEQQAKESQGFWDALPNFTQKVFGMDTEEAKQREQQREERRKSRRPSWFPGGSD